MEAKAAANLPLLVAGLSFALAFIFGAVANRVNFCTMGAVTDVVNFSDWRRMRMWVLAIAVAIVGSALLHATGLINLKKSIYTGSTVMWVSMLVGGFLFGFGMTLSSGCGSKTLIRAGAGNLKSWVVLFVLGIAAYMSLKGLFAVWRVNALDPWRFDVSASAPPPPTSRRSPPPRDWAPPRSPGCRSWWPRRCSCTSSRTATSAPRPTSSSGGIVVGLVIVGGWYITGNVGYLAEDPATLEEKFVATNGNRIESYSFVSPVAYTLELLMLWSDQSRIVTFGIAGVLGILVGSFAYAVVSKTFRWESFASAEDMGNHIVGGVLMGFGGVTALGCTIGQGLTGISTLALGSFLALGAIIAGCVAAVRYQMWRLEKMA